MSNGTDISDLEYHFSCVNLSNSYSSVNITRINYVVCMHESKSICGLYFQLFVESVRLFEATGTSSTVHTVALLRVNIMTSLASWLDRSSAAWLCSFA